MCQVEKRQGQQTDAKVDNIYLQEGRERRERGEVWRGKEGEEGRRQRCRRNLLWTRKGRQSPAPPRGV